MTLVLVVNAGSSSLKIRLIDDRDEVRRSADLPAGAGGIDTDALRTELAGWPAPACVAHRIVHGGTEFRGAVVVDERVEARLRELTALAPLHQPKSLAGLDAARAALPGVTEVACFDTAFHSTLPPEAVTYAVPARWRSQFQARRFGFHGLSHAFVARRSVEFAGGPARRVVSCHLGAGASLAAIVDGRCVDTTMGFTPLEGLVMATRSGSVDPGLVLWLVEQGGLAVPDVAHALEYESGMLALAGTADMRQVEDRAATGDANAVLALDVYTHRLAGAIAAMGAAAGGIDVLAFTGGVGEHSPALRAAAAERLGWLGVRVDAGRNDAASGDAVISPGGAGVTCVVVTAREDVQMNHEVRALLAATG